VRAEHPRTFEALGVDFGYVLYRTHLAGPAQGTLTLDRLRDYAVVTLGSHVVGTLDRRLRQDSLALDVPAEGGTLDVLVENTGRINFGRELVRDWKGLTGAVTFAGRPVTGWEMYAIRLEPLGGVRLAPATGGARDARARAAATGGASATVPEAVPSGAPAGPSFFRGTFTLRDVGDTWLDVRGWGKGVVWVNGHNLGRFWSIGPQHTLYLPGPWLRRGANAIVVLDLQPGERRSVEGLTGPVMDK
jgi:beta-galactosidase